ncbi:MULTISPECIES: hypothetical protein [unclassified Variovorax]|uniref:hypothetical protein n=1 Tax=unclassified Variovorax TaxID=663243 RepID=UPI0011AFC85E|nr:MULTISPECIES: hypothetical protein [unclassified Variovorax]
MEHVGLYGREGRYRYAFTFNPFSLPEVFGETTLRSLAEKGFWSPANPEGLTRDHRVSVNEAIRRNLDPFYIAHPINCELMTWHANNRKKTKSSMAYDELVAMVDRFEARRLCSVGAAVDQTMAGGEGFEPS